MVASDRTTGIHSDAHRPSAPETDVQFASCTLPFVATIASGMQTLPAPQTSSRLTVAPGKSAVVTQRPPVHVVQTGNVAGSSTCPPH
jgi:hypothetical protein